MFFHSDIVLYDIGKYLQIGFKLNLNQYVPWHIDFPRQF
jgi:hypothetical protein